MKRERIDDLLVEWELAKRAGREVSAHELCRDTPELTDLLAEKIGILRNMAWLEAFPGLDDGAAQIDCDSERQNANEAEMDRDAHQVDSPAGNPSETQLPKSDVTVAELLGVIYKHGLLDDQQQRRLNARIPTDRQGRAYDIAQDLVEQNVITAYQARVILQRGDSPLLLDRYVILDSVGSGGMGVVFKALQRSLERVVAVKVLPRNVMDSPEKVERFQREMRAAAKLSHPNVVQAYDAHEENGVYFYAMEYVPGSDLRELVISQGCLDAAEAIDITSQVAAGLAHAHRAGIVHRDVKPSNILLSDDGIAKVLDLGLARTHYSKGASPDAESLTKDGVSMGTVAFMSPEQAFDANKQKNARISTALAAPFTFCFTANRSSQPTIRSKPSSRIVNFRLPYWEMGNQTSHRNWRRCFKPWWPRTRGIARPPWQKLYQL